LELPDEFVVRQLPESLASHRLVVGNLLGLRGLSLYPVRGEGHDFQLQLGMRKASSGPICLQGLTYGGLVAWRKQNRPIADG